jgi:uncharacterized membrane protein YkgB
MSVSEVIGAYLPLAAVLLLLVLAVRWVGRRGGQQLIWAVCVVTGLSALLCCGEALRALLDASPDRPDPEVIALMANVALGSMALAIYAFKFVRTPR